MTTLAYVKEIGQTIEMPPEAAIGAPLTVIAGNRRMECVSNASRDSLGRVLYAVQSVTEIAAPKAPAPRRAAAKKSPAKRTGGRASKPPAAPKPAFSG